MACCRLSPIATAIWIASKSAKPEIEGILFQQALGQSEFRFTHRKNFELSGDNVFAELAQEQSGILASNELSPDLNREHRR